MRRVIVGLALLAIAAGMPAAASPDLEILSGSSVTLGVAGAKRFLDPQTAPQAQTWQAGFETETRTVVELPRIDLAFGEFVDLYHNQELLLDIDPASGVGSASLVLWLVDSDGNRTELPTTLTTGVPSTADCGGFNYCFGINGEPDYCSGMPWDDQTGDVRLVGVTLIPFGTGTTVDCSPLLFVVDAVVAPGDADGDLVEDFADNCPADSNGSQADTDADGVGDACDNCPAVSNPQQVDTDVDGAGNACEPLLVNFQPAAAPVPAGYALDSGQPFSGTNGFGWLGGAVLQVRDRNVLPDQLFDTFAFSSSVQTWEGTLPPGLYDLSEAIGDAMFSQGPQVVGVERILAFDQVTTAAGENLTALHDDQFVVDGRLSVTIGGGGGITALNCVTAVESPLQPFAARTVNFQPGGSVLPEGFASDGGGLYDPQVGYGWDAAGAFVRDRAILGDPVLDTLIFTNGTVRTWQLDLPADFYEVQISVGDSKFAQGPQSIVVEGQPWLTGAYTAAGEFLTLSGTVLVLDGALTVDVGDPGGVTTVNYVGVRSLPRDFDGDGYTNFVDNCIDFPNPDQADSDGDGVGDACGLDSDGDGWADLLDNCPAESNPDQSDGDADTRGDVCDCAPGDPGLLTPAIEVQGVWLAKGATTDLGWDDQGPIVGSSTVYDVVTQTISALRAAGGFGAATCLANGSSATTVSDGRIPAAGDGYLYLIRGTNACGDGTYGSGNGSSARATLDTAGPCP